MQSHFLRVSFPAALRKIQTFLSACFISLFLVTSVHAGLVSRDIDGDLTTDAYYDTDRNITWLRNANLNGAMNWTTASDWAANLSIGAYSDWRLPSGDSCHLGPCTTNDLSHLWYEELGNVEGGPMTNVGGFLNVQAGAYWTDFRPPLSSFASEVHFGNGDVGSLPILNLGYAMAIRDGDVAGVTPTQVPEPQSLFLVSIALLAMLIPKKVRRI